MVVTFLPAFSLVLPARDAIDRANQIKEQKEAEGMSWGMHDEGGDAALLANVRQQTIGAGPGDDETQAPYFAEVKNECINEVFVCHFLARKIEFLRGPFLPFHLYFCVSLPRCLSVSRCLPFLPPPSLPCPTLVAFGLIRIQRNICVISSSVKEAGNRIMKWKRLALAMHASISADCSCQSIQSTASH